MKRPAEPEAAVDEQSGELKKLKADGSPEKKTDDAATMNENGSSMKPEVDDWDDDDAPVVAVKAPAVKKGSECPYLDTISRQNLDFDFEKCCSVSLSHVNVYVCLVCGKYFQGRGRSTHAHTHSLDCHHHMFMKLDNGAVYCLPDNYQVMDRSLDDIRHVLSPNFTPEEVARLDSEVKWTRALDGTEYMPGLVGLNNMKRNDYANVCIQALARITPIRNFFLQADNYQACKSVLVQRFGELLRKIWNTRNFKGQVSPHEFMQAVMQASNKQFTIDTQSDPVDFWSWLVNHLHLDLTGGHPGKKSIITKCFQGQLEVTTLAGTGKGKAATSAEDIVEKVPFLLLRLDLPPTPVFKDAMERTVIPQVPIFDIMQKYDGQKVHHDVNVGSRRFRVTRLPQFLVLHMHRFTKNNFFVEKNPTIVNFPVKNLQLKDIIPLPPGKDGKAVASRYDLLVNVVHEGKAGQGVYRGHIMRQSEGQWYAVQDLHIVDVLPQMVALSEAYFQVYQLHK